MSTHRRKSHRDRKIFESGYGAFPGGDPRKFYPDEENPPELIEAHRQACAAWDANNGTPIAPAHRWVEIPGGVAHIAGVGFGLGGYSIRVPATARKHRNGRGWRERAANRERWRRIFENIENMGRAARERRAKETR